MRKELSEIVIFTKKIFKALISMVFNKPSKLKGLVFEVTDACNSRCKHCNIWRQKPTKNLLTSKEIDKIFSNSFFKNIEEVIITGGEPLLRLDLEEIILTIHKYIRPDALITLSTNGLMPKRAIKVTETLIKNGVNALVGVSLDGIGEKHDSTRGVKDNFKKVDYLLRRLTILRDKYQDKLKVIVGFTLSPLTVDSMKDVQKYAEKLGFLFLPQVYEEVSFYFNKGNVKASDNKNLIKAVQELPSSFRTSFQKEVMLKAVMGKNLKFRCSSMNTFFVLRCNGDISPCLRYSHLRLGNLKEKSIDEIWRNKTIEEARKTIRNCSECYNAWATTWSMWVWFPSFFPLLLRAIMAVIKKKLTVKNRRPPTNKLTN